MQRYAFVVLLVLAILSSAGCGGSAASPSPSVQATATLEPTATATASATPSPTVKPPATLSAEHSALLEAMAAKMQYPKGSYRIHATVQMSVGVGAAFDYLIDYSVSGADLDMTIDMSSGRDQMVMRMVAKGNIAYVKLGEQAWTSVEIDASLLEAMTAEWEFITEPGNFVFVRSDTLDGRDVLIFTNARPIPRPTEDNDYMQDADVYMTEMTMVVLPDATPLSMHAELEGTATVSYRGRDVSGQVDYEFSDVGKPIKIVAPAV